jgi:hypothetical protein
MDARGHTGYLTFAYKFVPSVPLQGGEEDGEEEEVGEGAEGGGDAEQAQG